MIYLFILIFINHILALKNKLTYQQLTYIKNILCNPNTPPKIKKKTENILIASHQKWLHKKVHTFAKNNKFSSQFKTELAESAKIGLLKSLRKYNASMPLYKYADKYLFYEFTISITEQMPMKYLNHYERYIKKVNATYPTFMGSDYFEPQTKQTISSPIFCFDNNSNLINLDFEIQKINTIISSLPEFQQQLFYTRYHKNTLKNKNKVIDVCSIFNISQQTYSNYMRIIMNTLNDSIYYLS